VSKYKKYPFNNSTPATSKKSDKSMVILTADFLQLKHKSVCKFR